jgi:hypothetical protein
MKKDHAAGNGNITVELGHGVSTGSDKLVV